MAVPLILSEVPNVTPYIQYVATSGQTVFPYPFPITQDSDLIVVVNGVTLNTDSGYTLSGQGNDTGGNVTFTLGQTAGAIITLYRDIAIERISQIAQNSGFSSTVFNAEFNNIYLIMQQLEDSIGFCLQVPNTNNPAPVTTLTPATYANKYLSFDSYGNPQPAALTSSGTVTAALVASLLNTYTSAAVLPSYVTTAAETAAGVTPTNFAYAPGDVNRYGVNTTPGTTDMSAALVSADAQSHQTGGAPITWSSAIAIASSVTTNAGSVIKATNPVTIASTKVLTINGLFIAPRQTIFQGITAGSQVIFNSNNCISELYPEWFGVVMDATTSATGTDNTSALSYAITAATSGSAGAVGVFPISIGNGYCLTKSQTLPPATVIYGKSRQDSGFVAHSAATGKLFTDTGSASKIQLTDLSFYGNGNTSITYVLQLGRNGTQHGTEGFCRALWAENFPSTTWAFDFDGNIAYYQEIAAYSVGGGIQINGSQSYAKNIVVAGCAGQGVQFGLVTVDGCEVEAPATATVPVTLAANASVRGLYISLPNTGTQTYNNLITIGSSCSLWNIDQLQVLCPSGNTVSNPTFLRSVDSTYFGGTVTSSLTHVSDGNYSSNNAGQTRQAFRLRITNTSGTLQHRIANSAGTATKFAGCVNAASATLTNTPTGTDSSTAFAAGGKIGSASTNYFWLDTTPQDVSYEMISATIEFNSTTTAGYTILPLLQSVDINGVTHTRVALALYDSSGSAVAWNTTTIPSSDIIQINVLMDISN